MQVVIFSSPERKEMLSGLMKELSSFPIHVIDSPETFGKINFWKRWKAAVEVCLKSNHDNFMIIPDDISNIDIEEIRNLFIRFNGKKFVCSTGSDDRTSCWGSIPKPENNFSTEDYDFFDFGFFDCGGVTNRETLKDLIVDPVPPSWFDRPDKSSGVGFQLTRKFQEMKAPMFYTRPSLSFHGNHESVMNKDARRETPMITRVKSDKVIIGIATFKGREKYLKKTIESLSGQCDEIRIYDNERNKIDRADNGKFYSLKNIKSDCYYLSCDDDIIYPPSYVSDMVEAIDRLGTIVTHHGRLLRGLDRSYYKGHESHHCLRKNLVTKKIDVAGTGVTGFHTSYFKPVNIYKSEFLRMSDLVFSLEAAIQEKEINLLPHAEGYIQVQDVPLNQTIYGMEVNKEKQQIQLANQIYKFNHGE